MAVPSRMPPIVCCLFLPLILHAWPSLAALVAEPNAASEAAVEEQFFFRGRISPANGVQWAVKLCHSGMRFEYRTVTRASGPEAGTFRFTMITAEKGKKRKKNKRAVTIRIKSTQPIFGKIRSYKWTIPEPSFSHSYHFQFGHFPSSEEQLQAVPLFLLVKFSDQLKPPRSKGRAPTFPAPNHHLIASVRDKASKKVLGIHQLESDEWKGDRAFWLRLDVRDEKDHQLLLGSCLRKHRMASMVLSVDEVPEEVCQQCGQRAPFNNGKLRTPLNCQHHFHPDCLNKWLKENKESLPEKCPSCVESTSASRRTKRSPHQQPPAMSEASSSTSLGSTDHSDHGTADPSVVLNRANRNSHHGLDQTSDDRRNIDHNHNQAIHMGVDQNRDDTGSVHSPNGRPRDADGPAVLTSVDQPQPPTQTHPSHNDHETAAVTGHQQHIPNQLITKQRKSIFRSDSHKVVFKEEPPLTVDKVYQSILEQPILQSGQAPFYTYNLDPAMPHITVHNSVFFDQEEAHCNPDEGMGEGFGIGTTDSMDQSRRFSDDDMPTLLEQEIMEERAEEEEPEEVGQAPQSRGLPQNSRGIAAGGSNEMGRTSPTEESSRPHDHGENAGGNGGAGISEADEAQTQTLESAQFADHSSHPHGDALTDEQLEQYKKEGLFGVQGNGHGDALSDGEVEQLLGAQAFGSQSPIASPKGSIGSSSPVHSSSDWENKQLQHILMETAKVSQPSPSENQAIKNKEVLMEKNVNEANQLDSDLEDEEMQKVLLETLSKKKPKSPKSEANENKEVFTKKSVKEANELPTLDSDLEDEEMQKVLWKARKDQQSSKTENVGRSPTKEEPNKLKLKLENQDLPSSDSKFEYEKMRKPLEEVHSKKANQPKAEYSGKHKMESPTKHEPNEFELEKQNEDAQHKSITDTKKPRSPPRKNNKKIDVRERKVDENIGEKVGDEAAKIKGKAREKIPEEPLPHFSSGVSTSNLLNHEHRQGKPQSPPRMEVPAAVPVPKMEERKKMEVTFNEEEEEEEEDESLKLKRKPRGRANVAPLQVPLRSRNQDQSFPTGQPMTLTEEEREKWKQWAMNRNTMKQEHNETEAADNQKISPKKPNESKMQNRKRNEHDNTHGSRDMRSEGSNEVYFSAEEDQTSPAASPKIPGLERIPYKEMQDFTDYPSSVVDWGGLWNDFHQREGNVEEHDPKMEEKTDSHQSHGQRLWKMAREYYKS